MLDLQESEKTCRRLQKFPKILEKVKAMLDLIEVTKVETADDFEEALIREVQGFGKDMIETWAIHEESRIAESLEKNQTAHHSKKNSSGTQRLEM